MAPGFPAMRQNDEYIYHIIVFLPQYIIQQQFSAETSEPVCTQ